MNDNTALKNPEKLFILSGPSGVGKNTVARELVQRDGIVRAVTATTREPRPGEKDGEDYFFVDKNKFESWLQAGTLLEYNEYEQNYYGTPVFAVNEATQKASAVLLVIDVNGALEIKRHYPTVRLIFIAPPDIQTLRERLRKRGKNEEESIKYRLERAKKELLLKNKYDCVVINDKLQETVHSIEKKIQDFIAEPQKREETCRKAKHKE